jgi:cytochrome c oxidase cbb3-type subunit 3
MNSLPRRVTQLPLYWIGMIILASVFGAALVSNQRVSAQQQAAPAAGAAPQPPQQGAAPSADHGGAAAFNPFGIVAYPDRPKAPQEQIDRGKATFSVNCAFCHGSDAGGGSVGPNLLRSEVVLQDKDGEAILPIVQGARMDRGMPKIEISPAQVSDIAAWLHSIPVKSNAGHEKINIVVGNADAGKTAFDKTCGSCHSVTGDLKGFAAKYGDPRDMQQAWIMPGMQAFRFPGTGGGAPVTLHVPPVTATVTQANGTATTGTLASIDEFLVAVTTPDGNTHTFTRRNGVPKVDIHDPIAAHRELLRKYNDKDIHDITAYLASLK